MKILDISSFYSERGGGVKTYHAAKLKYFKNHPADEYVLLTAAEKNDEMLLPGGRMYHVKGFPVGWGGAYRQMYDLRRIRKIIAKERPDVIEAGSPYLDCLLALLGRGNTGAKVVGFYHADVPDSYIAPAVKNLPPRLGNAVIRFMQWYVKVMYGRLDMTVAATRYIEDKLVVMGLDNTCCVPLGVDTELFTPDNRSKTLRAALGAGPNDKVLLFAGRFRKEKGIDTLAEVLRVLDKREGVKTVLVGDGPHDGKIREALKECTHTRLLGYEADKEKLAALYASADVFLAPGPYETFGLAALEAMSAGLPVVGANRGGTAELVSASGVGGLFEAHDAADFVRCIAAVLSTDLEDQRRRARNFATSRYSWTHTFDKMIETYAGLRRRARLDKHPLRGAGEGLVGRRHLALFHFKSITTKPSDAFSAWSKVTTRSQPSAKDCSLMK